MNTKKYGFFGIYTSLSMGQSLTVLTVICSPMHFGMRKLYDSLVIESLYKGISYYDGTVTWIFIFDNLSFVMVLISSAFSISAARSDILIYYNESYILPYSELTAKMGWLDGRE